MSEQARYRIQAVADRTGVPTATLRAWERRYRVPEPTRSATRYRLYDDHDVMLVRRMAALCASGLRPAEAARLVSSEAMESDPPSRVGNAERIVDAFDAFDDDALRTALQLAIAGGSPARIYRTVISPALHRVGERWAKGEISIAQEHLGARVVGEVLSTLLRLVAPPHPAPTAILACFEDEQHELGLLGFALHAAAWGYRPVVLGARTPPKAIADAIARQRPAIVALGVVVEPQVDVRATLAAYAKACGAVPWLVGGPASEAIGAQVRKRGGHVALDEVEGVRAQLDALVRAARSKKHK